MGKSDFSLSAIAAEANLYNTDKSKIGHQLFRNFLGLLPFGKQFIMQVLIVTDIPPVLNAVFKSLKTKQSNFSQNTLKIQQGNHLPQEIFFFIL